ncbi:hypothetical protein [Atopobium sp. oral taxon 416]|uniref:hypothetical protein n=1 Tax=Atopobium sp. oral taxon 416 TaxID=712157 RepID=UPI001BA75C78|nr:hypothetical protein [Atopobium sp. oral taxon 416]QUC03435.1 hypothetical protein J4859_00175 [Atopobium sp. oral taxon 416]
MEHAPACKGVVAPLDDARLPVARPDEAPLGALLRLEGDRCPAAPVAFGERDHVLVGCPT